MLKSAYQLDTERRMRFVSKAVKFLHASNFRSAVLLLLFAGIQVAAQEAKKPAAPEEDKTPAVLLHLPEWETVKNSAVYARNAADLARATGERPELSAIDFTEGVEAATAVYPVGRLVIVEFPTPQASVFEDQKVTAAIPTGSTTVYRRIGNYSVFVLDANDAAAANALLDQVKYQKYVQWLGPAPDVPTKAERDFTITTAGVFLSTFYAILLGITFAGVFGALFGLIYFRYREKERARMPTFSDAGGMVRLNLDGLTPEIVGKD
ncbi:MAG: hypothetical protein DYH05_03405 [Acidobacteria bacterium ACB1]|nr:hypothetical protein [Acidobacteria bacterium ACB1]